MRLLLFNILLVSQREMAGCIAECLLIAWWIEGLLCQVFCLIWNYCLVHFVHVWLLWWCYNVGGLRCHWLEHLPIQLFSWAPGLCKTLSSLHLVWLILMLDDVLLAQNLVWLVQQCSSKVCLGAPKVLHAGFAQRQPGNMGRLAKMEVAWWLRLICTKCQWKSTCPLGWMSDHRRHSVGSSWNWWTGAPKHASLAQGQSLHLQLLVLPHVDGVQVLMPLLPPLLHSLGGKRHRGGETHLNAHRGHFTS